MGEDQWGCIARADILTGLADCTVLGHLQHGGASIAFEQILRTYFGVFPAQAAAERKFGNVAELDTLDLIFMKDLAGKVRNVSPDTRLVQCAEAIGTKIGRGKVFAH